MSQSLADIERLSDRPIKAAAMDAEAAKTLDPITHAHGLVTIGRGGEVSMADNESQPGILDTIREKQDMITARASHQRLTLTGDALLLAVDAADSIKARNSLERMSAHQLARLHRLGMKFADKSEALLDQVALGISGWRPVSELQAASVEAARLSNAAVRAFAGCNEGCQALERTRRGGKQTVTVVHQTVAVGQGGQAVVAGAVGAGAQGAKRQGECVRMAHEAHVSRNFGRLKNGNRPGNPDNAPRCGARTRAGPPCKGPAMPNGRCRFHGGPSTGPRTPDGLERSRKARWKHGRYSAKAIEDRRQLRELLRHVRELLGRP